RSYPERLFDLAACAWLPLSLQTTFTHVCKEPQVPVQVGWFQICFADLPEPMWMVVVHQPQEERGLFLLTTLAITDAAQARLVHEQGRLRPSIEHTYRFAQEQGLDGEDMRVRSLEAMRRFFVAF